MRVFKLSYAVSAMIVFMVLGGTFQTVTAQKAKAKKKPKIVYYAIDPGTTFHVRLEQNLNSKTANVGDPIRTTTVDPIYSSGGILLIPAGSKIVGRVDTLTRAAKNGKPGTIGVSFSSLTLPNRRHVVMNGSPVPKSDGKNTVDSEGTASAKKTSHRNLKFIGGGTAGGAIIGGIAGGGTGAAIGAGVGAVGGFIGKKLSKGKEVEVSSGTEFGIYLNRSISLPRYHGQP